MPAVAAAVASLVGSLQLQGATLVGYSLGARLALLLGTDYGHLFRQVVSISGTAGLLGGHPQLSCMCLVQQPPERHVDVGATWPCPSDQRVLSCCR